MTRFWMGGIELVMGGLSSHCIHEQILRTMNKIGGREFKDDMNGDIVLKQWFWMLSFEEPGRRYSGK